VLDEEAIDQRLLLEHLLDEQQAALRIETVMHRAQQALAMERPTWRLTLQAHKVVGLP